MNSEGLTVKPHILYLARLLYPYLTLLIIPVARGVFLQLAYGEGFLSQTLVAEGIVLVLAFTVAFLRLKCTEICFNGDISVKRGLVFKVNYTVPLSAAKIIVLEGNPILKIFGAVRLKIYTEAGRRKRPDENLIIGRRTAARLYDRLRVNGQAVKSNTFGEVIMSAALSSFTAGLLLTIPAVKIIMSVLGKSLPTALPVTRSLNIENISLTEIGHRITALLILGYIVSFLVLFLRNFGFFSVKSGRKIMLCSGFLPRRTVFLESGSVRAVRTVTAPLMLLAKKCAVKFSACGYGRLKGEIGLLVPAVKPTLAKGLTSWLLPRFKAFSFRIRPQKSAAKRLRWLPFLLFTACVVLFFAFQYYLPALKDFKWLLSGLLAVLSVTLLLMRLYSLRIGGLTVNEGLITARGITGFSLDELQIKRESVLFVRISRTPFDIRYKQCSVKVGVVGKAGESVKVKYLDYEECSQAVFDKN